MATIDELIAQAEEEEKKKSIDDLITEAEAESSEEPPLTEDVPAEKGYFGRVAEAFTGANAKLDEEMAKKAEKDVLNNVNPVAGSIGAIGKTAGIVGSTAMSPVTELPPVKKLLGFLSTPSNKSNISYAPYPGMTGSVNIGSSEKTPDAAQAIAKKAVSLSEKYPNAANIIGGTLETIGLAATPFLGGLGGKTLGKIGKEVSEEAVDKAIEKGISKGVKPRDIKKRESLPAYEQFYDKAKEAVKTISDHKAELNILDEKGNPVTHPKTAAQMAQAIDQTKKIVYKKYSEMAKAAGDAGADFDPTSVEDKIKTLIDPDGFYKGNADAQAHAAKALEDVQALRGASPETVQERIREWNESLAGFYSNRAEKVNSRIDASIANALREQLDKQITEAVGEGYAPLKRQYGALKEIERDVNHRALVNARSNSAKLVDFTDIFSGGELAAGLLTLNPALIAKAGTQYGVKEVIKFINNPEHKIDKMFRAAYKLDRPQVLGNVSAEINYDIPAYARKGINIPLGRISQKTPERLALPAPMVGEGAVQPPLPTMAERLRAIGTEPEGGMTRREIAASRRKLGNLEKRNAALGEQMEAQQPPQSLATPAQAQGLGRIFNERGAVGGGPGAPEMLLGASTGTIGGVTAGSQIGDTPEERTRNALLGGVGGAVGGFMAPGLIRGAKGTVPKIAINERGAIGGIAENAPLKLTGQAKDNFIKWKENAEYIPVDKQKYYEFETGKPVVIEAFHGSDKSFNVFDDSKLGQNTSAPSAKKAHFFSNNPSNASYYPALTEEQLSDYYKRLSKDVRKIMNENNVNLDEAINIRIKKLEEPVVKGKAILESLKEPIDKYSKYFYGNISKESMLKKIFDGIEEGKPSLEELNYVKRSIRRNLDQGQNFEDRYNKLYKMHFKENPPQSLLEQQKKWVGDQNYKTPYEISQIIKQENPELYTKIIDAKKNIDKLKKEHLSNKHFNEWIEYANRKNAGGNSQGEVWSSADEDLSANVQKNYVKIKNPYVHDFGGDEYRDESFNDLIKKAIANGHDGFIFVNTFDPYRGNIYGLLPGHQTQIKSAIGNVGTYSKTNPDMTKALVGAGAGLASLAAYKKAREQ